MRYFIRQFPKQKLIQGLVGFLVLFIPGALNHVTLSNSEGLVWSQESHAGLTQAEKSRITSHLASLHIPFIANEGQVSREVKYYAR